MILVRLARFVVLWSLVVAAWSAGWMASTGASTFDQRVPWGTGWCLAAVVAGLAVAHLAHRLRPLHWARLPADLSGLALLFAGLCSIAMAQIAPDATITALREQLPPFFAPIHPLLAAALPLVLARHGTRLGRAESALLVAVFCTTLSGALLLLSPAFALGLGLLAAIFALRPEIVPFWRHPLALLAVLFALLMIMASLHGHNPFAARPSLQWILALLALGAAVALRPRDERGWRRVLGVSVIGACVIALAGALLTAWLARHVAPGPALASRLVLFRQHPNFLGPFFGFHAVLALGLALGGERRRRLWLLALALLAVSCVLTDSKTGIASMLLGALCLPAFPLLSRWVDRARPLLAFGALAAAAVIALLAWFFVRAEGPPAWLAERLPRFGASRDFRLDAWRNSLAVIADSPWTGIGPNTFIALERFLPGSRYFNAPQAPHPHAVPLYVAQAGGLLALAVFVAWVALLWLRLARRANEDEGGPWLAAGAASAFVALVAANLVDVAESLLTVAPAPIFALTGLAVCRARAPRVTLRPASYALCAGLVLAVFVMLSWGPARAAAALDQARLLTWEAGRDPADDSRKLAALRAAERAVEHDPWNVEAVELLARLWEPREQGFSKAHRVLAQRVQRAPRDGAGHAQLAMLYLRAGMFAEAEREFVAALQDPQGSATVHRDRAQRIACLARLGRRDEALEQLVAALLLDTGVLSELPWSEPRDQGLRLAVGGEPGTAPIALDDAVEIVFARRAAEQLAGRPVGRAYWMDTYNAWRVAGRDDRAADLLDWLELQGVTEVENWTLALERGRLAFDAGDLERARERFLQAFELSGNPYFKSLAAKAGADESVETGSVALARTALAQATEILDQPMAFRENFATQCEQLALEGAFGPAAEALRRTLLFVDDPLERVEVWARVGALRLQAGDVRGCFDAVSEALELLVARPYPVAMLDTGLSRSAPARLALLLSDALRSRGLPARARLHEAWGLADFFSARPAAGLFRLAFYEENGLVDQLLREADLQLLGDADHLPAAWARQVALEASGRHLELADAMRTLVERNARRAAPERLFTELTGQLRQRVEAGGSIGPDDWTRLGLLDLLRGRYAEAGGMFENARKLLDGDPRRAAELCGWEAQAAFLASRPGKARAALLAGLALRPESEMLQLRLSVIPENLDS